MTINDIVNSIYIKTKTNVDSYPAADMLIAINNAYERVSSIIMLADKRWQWDDSNQTDLPIATTQVNADQKDYSLATSHLKIARARIKNAGGTWSILIPIDPSDADYELIMDSTSTGIPTHYDKTGISVKLGPTPNYTQAASLEVTFQRAPVLFTSAEVTTGTKQPGFNSLYHDLIPLWVAYNYALDNTQPTANGYLTEIIRKEEALKLEYTSRDKDDRTIITSRRINFI